MAVLFPHLSFDAVETPLSFATRLSNFHLRSNVVPFLHDIGVRPAALLGCEEAAVQRLAAIANVDITALQRNSARRVEKRRYDLRGNVLSAEIFSSPHTVFCPACLREDDQDFADAGSSRRGRLGWTLRPVRTCARHGLALIHRKKQRWDDLYQELARRVPERGDTLDRLIESAHQQEPSPLQAYVMARLDGVAGPTWLDKQTLEQAVRTTEMLGMLIVYGPEKKPSELGPTEWEHACRAGHAVTSVGEPAIRDALQAIQADSRSRGRQAGPRQVFGALYQWLSSPRNNKEPGDISRIVREQIFGTMVVAPGESILGGTLTDRRLHSVESLAAESKLDARTLRNVLAASGLIPVEEDVSERHIFDAADGRRVAASIQRLTHVIGLPKALNCTRPQADQLVDERLLIPISEGPGGAAGRTWKAVDNLEITRFIADLHACAQPADTVAPGLVPISKAAEKAKAPCIEIIHLVLGGFLENVIRHNGIAGYAAIFVNPDEVRTQIAAQMSGLSASAVFGKLQIPKSTGWALTHREQGPRLEPVVIGGKNGRHRFYRFTEEAVAAFMSEFTTDARIAVNCEVRPDVMVARLKKARVAPVLARSEIGLRWAMVI